MHPQLLDRAVQFRSTQVRLHALADRLSPEQWPTRAAPGPWSVGECVEHRNLTSRAQARCASVPVVRRATR